MLDVEFIVTIIYCYLFNIFLLFCLAHLAIVPVQFGSHPLIVVARESLNARTKMARRKINNRALLHVLYFSSRHFFPACLDFSSLSLSAPRSPRMFRACLVPGRRLFRPSRSMHFGDVSETNGRETPRQSRSAHV